MAPSRPVLMKVRTLSGLTRMYFAVSRTVIPRAGSGGIVALLPGVGLAGTGKECLLNRLVIAEEGSVRTETRYASGLSLGPEPTNRHAEPSRGHVQRDKLGICRVHAISMDRPRQEEQERKR